MGLGQYRKTMNPRAFRLSGSDSANKVSERFEVGSHQSLILLRLTMLFYSDILPVTRGFGALGWHDELHERS
jgi:hypothetical protein